LTEMLRFMMTFSIAVVRSSFAATVMAKVCLGRAAVPRISSGPFRSRVLKSGKEIRRTGMDLGEVILTCENEMHRE
jgi:hypothetical protein